jgi:hypothetical protein
MSQLQCSVVDCLLEIIQGFDTLIEPFPSNICTFQEGLISLSELVSEGKPTDTIDTTEGSNRCQVLRLGILYTLQFSCPNDFHYLAGG